MKHATMFCASLALSVAACDEDEPEPTPDPSASSTARQAASAKPPSSPRPEEPEPSEKAASLGDFEGEIDVKVDDPDPGPEALTFLVKGEKLRMELPASATDERTGKVAQIIDLGDGSMISLIEKKKIAMEMGMDNLKEQTSRWAPGASSDDPAAAKEEPEPELKKTDRTATIAGHECRYWDVLHESGRSSVCLTDEGVFELPASAFPEWSTKLFKGRFPLRVVNYDASGAEKDSLEVTRIEKKDVPDSAFEVPSGYRRTNLADMMKGMMPGMVGGDPDKAGGQMPSKKQMEEAQKMLRQMRQKQKAKQ